jgi:hypothetical protein
VILDRSDAGAPVQVPTRLEGLGMVGERGVDERCERQQVDSNTKPPHQRTSQLEGPGVRGQHGVDERRERQQEDSDPKAPHQRTPLERTYGADDRFYHESPERLTCICVSVAGSTNGRSIRQPGRPGLDCLDVCRLVGLQHRFLPPSIPHQSKCGWSTN